MRDGVIKESEKGQLIEPKEEDSKNICLGCVEDIRNDECKPPTVDRSINYANLLSKLNGLCEYNFEIRLRYKLPGQDLDALVSIFDDDDVENMMFEYDLLRCMSPTPPRLRLFVFFAVAPPTPVTARSVNPDFLFGFNKEYSLNYTEPLKNPDDTDTVVSPSRNNDVDSACGLWIYSAYPLSYTRTSEYSNERESTQLRRGGTAMTVSSAARLLSSPTPFMFLRSLSISSIHISIDISMSRFHLNPKIWVFVVLALTFKPNLCERQHQVEKLIHNTLATNKGDRVKDSTRLRGECKSKLKTQNTKPTIGRTKKAAQHQTSQ
ncbi:hypothetical protein L2E82_39118 [Cichorium intybus]|uniref:Uncharacterized protein n=1 Tax=Cichorium intybus TaxID=13427 RepID=A0ACB9AI41_CICIN|nr:hypothetical protein L2E82_39118 [Cichorium intybus]